MLTSQHFCHYFTGLGSGARLCFPDVLFRQEHGVIPPLLPLRCLTSKLYEGDQILSPAQRGAGSGRTLGISLRRYHSHTPSQNICALSKTALLCAPQQQVRYFLGKELVAQIQPHNYICALLYEEERVCKLKGNELCEKLLVFGRI